MEKSDGFLNKITKHQKTRILPLRLIGNLCGEIAATNLVRAIDYDDNDNHGLRFKYRATMWKIFNKPYSRWGTYYMLTISDSSES